MAKQLQTASDERRRETEERNHMLSILRLNSVKARTGLSRSTIYAKVAR